MALTKAHFRMIEGTTLNIKDFGAVGDGVTDSTAAFVAAATAMSSNATLRLPSGTYLISAANAVTHQSGAAYGKVAMALTSLSNIVIEGEGATIKIVNHDCSTGGLTFVNFRSCQNVKVSGIKFDMTFTGVNTSASLYPFCGAITALDDAAAGQSQSDLCGDFLIEDCEFKLYHPFGSYAQSGAPFSGDPNNGYKVFSIFVSGASSATTYTEQNRNITVRGCTFKDGHNAYGIWVWAWNNALIDGCVAEAWVSKYSTAAGSFGGGGVPMIRHMQFYSFGLKVTNNSFRALPCNLRTGAFEGRALFMSTTGQIVANIGQGETVVSNNTIHLGNGDAANSQLDYGVSASCYGAVVISDNSFDAIATTTNAYGGSGIIYNPESTGGGGLGSLSITGNTFGSNMSYFDSITILNASSVDEYSRRAKSIVVSNNISLSQVQYFLDMTGNTAQTYRGCRSTVVSDNIIVGTFNTVFDKTSTNSRAMRLGANVAGDQLSVVNNIIRDKNVAFSGFDIATTADALIENNRLYGVTTPLSGVPNTVFQSLTKTETYTPVVTGSSVAGTGTYTLQFGRYNRVGNIIHYNIGITLTNHTGSGQMQVSLPVAARSTGLGGSTAGYIGTVFYDSLAAGADKQVSFVVAGGASVGTLRAMDSNNGAASVLNIDTACTFVLSGWYEANL